MKYIRTKDGSIWEYDEKENIAQRPNYQFKCNQVWVNFRKEDIVKQADTIEELCDEFVKVFDDGCIIIEPDITIKTGKYNKFGAIWTDKGLIYAAKMNKKGKFELL